MLASECCGKYLELGIDELHPLQDHVYLRDHLEKLVLQRTAVLLEPWQHVSHSAVDEFVRSYNRVDQFAYFLDENPEDLVAVFVAGC